MVAESGTAVAMKEIIYLCSCILAAVFAALPSPASAGFQGPVNSGGTESMSVDKVLGLKLDRDNVCISGRIISRLATDDDKYVFQDMTGEIVVEIDNETFAGQSVTPQDRVRLCGEVETELFRPNEFEAATLQLLR